MRSNRRNRFRYYLIKFRVSYGKSDFICKISVALRSISELHFETVTILDAVPNILHHRLLV